MTVRFGLVGSLGPGSGEDSSARRLPRRDAFGSVDDLLGAVDAVAMAIPPAVQADLALRIAEAGRHLLLEKPLSLTTESADRIVETVNRRRLASVMFFTLRFNPDVDVFLSEAERADGWHSASGVMYASITARRTRALPRRGGGRRAACGTWARTPSRSCFPFSAR